MRSRVHPKYKTKYRVGNWPAYDRALVERGDITLWLSHDAIESWRPKSSGKSGGQQRFSDLAIETTLTVRLMFHLPLRQTEGFVRSLLHLMNLELEAPDHTTLSRRAQHLKVHLRRHALDGPLRRVVWGASARPQIGYAWPRHPYQRRLA